MADDKVSSNGRVDVWAVPVTGIADPDSPTAAEINAGVRLTPAIAWSGTTFPAADSSSDVDDRSLEDVGNALSRGYAQYGAELSFFRPVLGDTTSDYADAWALFRETRSLWYLVTRVLQRSVAPATTVATAGDWISVYKVMNSTVSDDTAGEDSVKFVVGFMPQGYLAVNTQVKGSAPATIARVGSGTVAVGATAIIRATLGGKRATNVVDWSSSDPAVATVSQNGVVTGVSAGSANITANHAAATTVSTAVAITVA